MLLSSFVTLYKFREDEAHSPIYLHRTSTVWKFVSTAETDVYCCLYWDTVAARYMLQILLTWVDWREGVDTLEGVHVKGKDPWKKQSNLAISRKWQDSVSIMFENWFFCCCGELYLIAVNSVTSFVLFQTIRWARICSVSRPNLVWSWGLDILFACLVYTTHDTGDSNAFSNQHLWHDQSQLRCT